MWSQRSMRADRRSTLWGNISTLPRLTIWAIWREARTRGPFRSMGMRLSIGMPPRRMHSSPIASLRSEECSMMVNIHAWGISSSPAESDPYFLRLQLFRPVHPSPLRSSPTPSTSACSSRSGTKSSTCRVVAPGCTIWWASTAHSRSPTPTGTDHSGRTRTCCSYGRRGRFRTASRSN
jgi:hypothetical protein